MDDEIVTVLKIVSTYRVTENFDIIVSVEVIVHYPSLTCWLDLTIHKLFATRADLHRTV